MKDKRISEELSAYIDGEAEDSETTRRRIQQDAAYAKRHMELCKLSSHLKTLSPPEVQPAFLARVMAQVQHSGPPVPHPLRRYAISVAGAAAVILIVVGFIVYSQLPITPISGPAIVEQRGAPRESAGTSEATRALRQLQEGLAGGNYVEAADAAQYLASEDYFDVYSEDILPVLASTEWFQSVARSFEAQEDLDRLIETLNVKETSVLATLLKTYAKEGQIS